MVASKVALALGRLGLADDAVRVYQAMLERAPMTLDEVQASSGLDGQAFRTAYAELVDVGLAGAADPEEVVAPRAPEPSLEVLGRRRTAEIDESRITVANAFDAFRRERMTGASDDLVEVVTGAEIGRRMQQVWRSARDRIRQIDSPPYVNVDGGVDDALETLGRGVSHRMIYARESLVFPGKLAEDIERCIEAGEQARVVNSAPVKMIIIDDRLVTVAPAISEVDVFTTLLVVRPSPLFSACTALFEAIWNTAVPFHDRATDSPRLLPADRKLLSLLAAGLSDDEIATELVISRRTLYRRLEILSARLGAVTRFQMALQAQRRGWV